MFETAVEPVDAEHGNQHMIIETNDSNIPAVGSSGIGNISYETCQ